MVSLAIWLAILCVCFGVGASALRLLRADSDSGAEEIPFAAALGMGILSYLVLAVGLLGYLRVWAGVALIALLAVLGSRQVARLGKHLRAAVAAAADLRWAALPLLLFFLIALILTLIGALAPSAGADYDGLVYHLAIPKLYVARGAIHPIPWLTHSNFPFTLEMLYLLGLLLHDQALAKLFHFGCGWLTVCAIFAFGRRWWGARAGWLGGAMFAAIPLVGWQLMSAYNELAFALYALLAVYALARWVEGQREGRSGGWLWVAGIMCGLALGVKMLGAAVLLFALAAVIWGLARRAVPARAVTRVVAFAALALAVASPWYIKSYRWTGNPVYPFFYQVFGGKYWTQQRADAYTEAQKEFGLGRGPAALVSLPWNLTMRPRWFFDHASSLRRFNVFITVFGPLLLAFLPALLVTGPVGGPGRLLLWFALCYAAIWFGLTQNGRYLMPVLPGLCACAGLATRRLLEGRGALAPATLVALLLGLSAGLYPSFLLAAPAARVAVGAESRDAYLSRSWQIYPMFEAIENLTPPDARILVLGDEPRFFYLERDYLLGNHAEIFASQDLAGPEAFLSALRGMGVTHLLLPASALSGGEGPPGRIEVQIAGLAAAGRIRPLLRDRRYPLVLWRIGNERGESPG